MSPCNRITRFVPTAKSFMIKTTDPEAASGKHKEHHGRPSRFLHFAPFASPPRPLWWKTSRVGNKNTYGFRSPVSFPYAPTVTLSVGRKQFSGRDRYSPLSHGNLSG